MLTYQEYNTVKDWLFTNHGPHQWFSQKDYCEFLYLLSDGEDWQLARESDQLLAAAKRERISSGGLALLFNVR